MTYARDLILTATILSLIYTAAHQPAPANAVQVDYCKLDTGAFEPCAGLQYSRNI